MIWQHGRLAPADLSSLSTRARRLCPRTVWKRIRVTRSLSMHRLAAGLAVALVILATAAPLWGQDRAALINEQMDKLVELEINATLPEAMEVIADTTGVPIKADPTVWDLLPWGQQTNINATIKNQTLRQA